MTEVTFHEVPRKDIAQLSFPRSDLMFHAPSYLMRHYSGNSLYIAFRYDKDIIGYSCIGLKAWYKNSLLEFHLLPGFYRFTDVVYDELCRSYELNQVTFNSLDVLLASIVSNRGYQVETMGLIFRYEHANNKEEFTIGKDCTFGEASPEDLDEIYDALAQPASRDFYLLYKGKKDALWNNMKQNEVFVLKKDGKLAGIGFLVAFTNLSEYMDIGMLVRPDFRQQGFGTYIVKSLVQYCMKEDKIPVAGCSQKNEASARTLVKCGFYPIARSMKATFGCSPKI